MKAVNWSTPFSIRDNDEITIHWLRKAFDEFEKQYASVKNIQHQIDELDTYANSVEAKNEYIETQGQLEAYIEEKESINKQRQDFKNEIEKFNDFKSALIQKWPELLKDKLILASERKPNEQFINPIQTGFKLDSEDTFWKVESGKATKLV